METSFDFPSENKRLYFVRISDGGIGILDFCVAESLSPVLEGTWDVIL